MSADMSEAGRKAWATRKANQLARANGAMVALVSAARSAQTPSSGVKSAVMSDAGRKAWATRIANLQAKGLPLPAPKVAAASEPAPVARAVSDARAAARPVHAASVFEVGQPVTMWLEDDRRHEGVGAGIRCFIVREVGPTKVELYYPPAVRTITVSRHEFDRYARPYKARPQSKRISDGVNAYEAARIEYDAREVRSVRDLVDAYFAKGGEVHKVERNTRTVDEWEWPRVMATGQLPSKVAA